VAVFVKTPALHKNIYETLKATQHKNLFKLCTTIFVAFIFNATHSLFSNINT